MDVREKLVELIAQKVCETWSGTCDQWLPHDCGKCYANDCHISEIADHLISNGVTVQEWISVDERLPDDNDRVIAFRPNESETSAYKYCVMWGWSVKVSLKQHRGITHWMSLPEPPKGE